MTIQAITNFITVTDRAGATQHRYQNGKVGEIITLNSQEFSYLAFLYRGATRNRTGDNLQAELTLAPNAVAMDIVQQAVANRWFVRVQTCTMNPSTFAVGRVLTSDVWIATTFNYDADKLTTVLSSGIDAVGATAPTLSLTSRLVGALPTTGQIQNR